jgi:hypothetical protein
LKKYISVIFLCLIAWTFNANAATLDFSVFSTGYQGTTTLTLPEATLTSFGTDFYVGAASIGNEVCAIQGHNCEADLEISFNSLVSNLSFVTSGWDDGDSVSASIYDASNSLLATIIITSNTLVDFSTYTGISRLFLDDNSSGYGIAYDQFNFNTTTVPVPAAVWLFGSGLLGMIGFSRRKREIAG